jgi:hypothetical protein
MSLTWSSVALDVDGDWWDYPFPYVLILTVDGKAYAFREEHFRYLTSTNSGTTWGYEDFGFNVADHGAPPTGNPLEFGGDEFAVSDGSVSPDESTIVLLANSAGYYANDKGLLWLDIATSTWATADLEGDFYQIVLAIDATTWMAATVTVGNQVKIATTTNSGTSWTTQTLTDAYAIYNSGQLSAYRDNDVIIFCFPNPADAVSPSDHDYIFSTDGGATWDYGEFQTGGLLCSASMRIVKLGSTYIAVGVSASTPGAIAFSTADPTAGVWTAQTLPAGMDYPEKLIVVGMWAFAYDAIDNIMAETADGETWAESNTAPSGIYTSDERLTPMGAVGSNLMVTYQGEATGALALVGSAYTASCADSLNLYLRESIINATWLRQALLLSDAPTASLLVLLIERITLTGTPTPKSGLHAEADDAILYASGLTLSFSALIEEGVEFAGTASANRGVVAALIDYLHATGTVSSRRDAVAAITSVIAINGLLFNGWRIEQLDTIAFQDALAAQLQAVTQLVDSVSFTDTGTAQLRMMALVADGLDLGEELSTHLAASASLSDQVLFYCAIRLGVSEFSGWVLNEGRALSQYSNYPFNGFVEFPRGSKRYLGTSDDGLFRLEGTSDAGTDIVPRLRTALLDFGTGLAKELPDIYIANRSAGDFVLKVIVTDEAGLQHEHHYIATVPAGTARAGRFKAGRGLNPVYWQFELTPDDGILDLLNLKFRPVIIDKGRI